MPEFQFIDGSNIDKSTRKQIRSSVMMGRNAGKKKKRTERGENQKPEKILMPLLPRVGNDFSVFSYPRPFKPYMQELIYQFVILSSQLIYPRELCVPSENYLQSFFQMLQIDEAFFNSSLAMAHGYADFLSGTRDESKRTLRFLSETYKSINENLRKEGIPSDGTVAAVMSITMHNNLLRAPANAAVHLDALERMVNIRGGIESFEGRLLILQKICRTDIEYSLQSGFRPRFYRDKFPHDLMLQVPNWTTVSREASEMATTAQIIDPDIRDVFVDAICASKFLNNGPFERKLDPWNFQEVLISISYRLLHSYPLFGTQPDQSPDNACYLSMLALITTMLIPHENSTPHKLLANKFRSCLCGDYERLNARDLVTFWLFYVASISVLNQDEDRDLFSSTLKGCALNLGISNWQDARFQLSKFPWIRHFHDKPGERLWQYLNQQ